MGVRLDDIQGRLQLTRVGWRCLIASRTAKLKSSTDSQGTIPDGIIINPAAFTHTSVAILDALVLTELLEVRELRTSSGEKVLAHSYIPWRPNHLRFRRTWIRRRCDDGTIGAKKEK